MEIGADQVPLAFWSSCNLSTTSHMKPSQSHKRNPSHRLNKCRRTSSSFENSSCTYSTLQSPTPKPTLYNTRHCAYKSKKFHRKTPIDIPLRVMLRIYSLSPSQENLSPNLAKSGEKTKKNKVYPQRKKSHQYNKKKKGRQISDFQSPSSSPPPPPFPS